jgi:hypothetical protein
LLPYTRSQAWHLRRGSGAACAAQLRAALAGLPAADGADVLLLLGGIDCSEGLVQALAKGKVRRRVDACALCVCWPRCIRSRVPKH